MFTVLFFNLLFRPSRTGLLEKEKNTLDTVANCLSIIININVVVKVMKMLQNQMFR